MLSHSESIKTTEDGRLYRALCHGGSCAAITVGTRPAEYAIVRQSMTSLSNTFSAIRVVGT